MKFSGVIANDQSEARAKGQGQRSKVKVTEVKTHLNRFRTVTPVWIPRRDGRVVKVPDSGLRVTCNSATRGSNTSAATGHLRCRSEQAA